MVRHHVLTGCRLLDDFFESASGCVGAEEEEEAILTGTGCKRASDESRELYVQWRGTCTFSLRLWRPYARRYIRGLNDTDTWYENFVAATRIFSCHLVLHTKSHVTLTRRERYDYSPLRLRHYGRLDHIDHSLLCGMPWC